MSENKESSPLWHVSYWGAAEDSQAFIDAIANCPKNAWFDCKEKAVAYRDYLSHAAKRLRLTLCTSLELDEKPFHRLFVAMDFILPSGERIEYAYDFGHCYDVEAAEFMFFDGHFACDCNRSNCIIEVMPEFEPLECGETIEIENFKTAYVLDMHLESIGIMHSGAK